ncbi:MAG: CPBP family intramembrane metalloprotease [Thermoprotei archaeon]|nr:CPBP family intramembrane metalloprotease [Thermoprotei archaeon]
MEVVFLILAWFLQAAYPSGYGRYSKVFMIMLGLLGILAHKRSQEYGLRPKSFRFSLKWSVYIATPFIIVSLAILMLALMGGLSLPKPVELVNDLVWYFIFVGFAEELFFRGYIQSRLNEVFIKKYGKFLGVKYEWSQGTLVTAIFFFGLPHLLTGINPFMGKYRIDSFTVFMTGSAIFMGLVLGVVREKTGFILVPTVLHGFMDFIALALGKVVGLAISNIATGIVLFIFFAMLFEELLKESV